MHRNFITSEPEKLKKKRTARKILQLQAATNLINNLFTKYDGE